MVELAHEAGFRFTQLNWQHPRQQWALFSKPDFSKEPVGEAKLDAAK
jgi:hypothetical protein